MLPRSLPILFLFIAPLVSSKERIISRALKIFNDSVLVTNTECDSRRDHHACEHFTLFHIYAFAAKVPPSGARGYITDEPQFACSKVDPPQNDTIGWAALVMYSRNTTRNCDCTYEEKIMQIQAAGYRMALLMETTDCNNDYYDFDNDDDNNVTGINISAVLVSQSLGETLLKHSVLTDRVPSSEVVVLALYGEENATLVLIVVGCLTCIVVSMITVAWICGYYKKYRKRLKMRTTPYEILSETKHENPPMTSNDTNNDEEINNDKEQLQANGYGTLSDHHIHVSSEPKIKLQVDD